MNSRILILALAAIFVIAVAVPALGQTNEVTPTVTQELSVRALAKARLALLTARSAKSESRRAARTAEAALNVAKQATGPTGSTGAVGPTGATGPAAAAVQSDFAAAAVVTESTTFEQLSGGPSVTVTVPSSGLIEVWAQATMDEPGGVSLYEDGQPMPGQSESALCTNEPGEGVLFAGVPIGPPGPITVGTPAPTGFCGTEGPPGGVLFQTTPGQHTYELRYEIAGCGCAPEVTFSNRLLRVGPRL